MTISEHLQFSVLTAPVAAIDRRGLSQAWYSALYRANSEAPAQQAAARLTSSVERPGRTVSAQRTVQPHRSLPAPKDVGPYRETCERGAPVERRAPRSALTRKIERALLDPAASARKGFFTIEGSAGRVQILLHERGTRVKLIAICSPKAKTQVAAALAQARYALAARGVHLEAQTREVAC